MVISSKNENDTEKEYEIKDLSNLPKEDIEYRSKEKEIERTSEDISIKESIISFDYTPKYTGNFAIDKEIFQKTCVASLKYSYNINAKRLLDRALDLVYELFKDDRRGDGSMFYTHFLETADLIMTKFYFDDVKTVAAALLHDAPEDKPEQITIKDIENKFDPEVAQIVDGVTKITKTEELKESDLIPGNYELTYDEQEIATIQKVFAMGAQNPKIFIVKLADRFHNVFTLYGIKKPERRYQIAKQTLNVYVPLLKGLGFENLSREMQDRCLFHIVASSHDDAQLIYNKLKSLHRQESINFTNFTKKYKLEEFFNSHFKNALFLIEHRNLFELYNASKPDIVRIAPDYSYFFFVLVYRTTDVRDLSLFEIESILKAHFKYLGKNELSPVVRQRLLEETKRLTFARYTLATSDNKQFELEIVAEHPDTTKGDRRFDIKRRFNREFYKFYDPSEYESFLDITTHLIKENIRNKIDVLLSLSKKLYPDEHISVTLLNDNNIYLLPKGSVPLDLAFKAYRNKALFYITAKVSSSESHTSKTVPLNYILRNGEKVEIILGKTPTLSVDSMDYVCTLYAYNSLKKHFQSGATNFYDKSKQKGKKKVSIAGSNRLGINAAIGEIALNLNINFTDIQLKVNPSNDAEFQGFLTIEYSSLEHFNIFLLNLAAVQGIKTIKVLEISP